MNKIKLALHSRTVWTIVLLFLINGITGVQEFIPENLLSVLTPVLSLIAIYFRVNTQAESKV